MFFFRKYQVTISLFVFAVLVAGCSSMHKARAGKTVVWVEETNTPIRIDTLPPGITVYEPITIHYRRQHKNAFNIQFGQPVVVSTASKPEKWGFFQFPEIDRLVNNSIRIRWRLNADAMEAYGQHAYGEAISKDEGRTFQVEPQQHIPFTDLLLPNGDRLSIHTPKPIPVTELQLPAPVGSARDTYTKSVTQFYRLHHLPAKAQALYFDRFTIRDTAWKTEPASLTDSQAARYTLRGHLPIIWWGDLHVAPDRSIIAGIYPGFYVALNGSASHYNNVFFYRSTDNGHHWHIQGRIRYKADTMIDPKGNQRMGFTEPAYEILPNGTFICVMRTTDGIGNGPMYVSHSKDNGITWSTPEVLTASGVLPRLLQLKNGVLVMSTGRPGVQLRFSKDAHGKVWSNAFEMMPYKDYKDPASCGYTGLLPTGPDRFLIVYSDFKYTNSNGEIRKVIKVREVIVTPE